MININLITTGFQKSGRIVSAIRNSSHRFDDIYRTWVWFHSAA